MALNEYRIVRIKIGDDPDHTTLLVRDDGYRFYTYPLSTKFVNGQEGWECFAEYKHSESTCANQLAALIMESIGEPIGEDFIPALLDRINALESLLTKQGRE